MKLNARKQPCFSDSKPACALRGHWVSFCLVDELGIGAVYGGLPYTIHDSAGQMHKGRLDKNGFARLQDIYCGPVVIAFDDLYSGTEKPYSRLVMRRTYPLPITELQIRAEQSSLLIQMVSVLTIIRRNKKPIASIRLRFVIWSVVRPIYLWWRNERITPNDMP